jgi:hypothetical protein
MGFQPMDPSARCRCHNRSGWRALGAFDYFPDCGSELFDARARDDDGIAAAMCFFRNPQEFATLVLPKLHVKVLPFDLELSRLDDIIHFQQNGGV